MSSYEYETEKICRKLNIELHDLVHNDYGYSCVIQFMHYYRMKDIYDISINNKTYNRTYLFKYFDYENLFKTGFNRIEMGFQLHEMRYNKNQCLNTFISNYQFYRLDRNINMYYASKNIIQTLYKYASLFENNSENPISESDENNCLNDLIYAFNLYYTMLNKENMISDDEMNKLTSEKHNIHDIIEALNIYIK